jgi:hypothetical protein
MELIAALALVFLVMALACRLGEDLAGWLGD